MVSFKFGKDEKLCSQKLIGELFLSGGTFLCYPLKVVWKFELLGTPHPAQVVFSVPKRLFKKAHDRNLLKRQMREVYRLRKHELYELLNLNHQKLVFMLVYIAKEKVGLKQLENAMNKVFGKFRKSLEHEG